MLKSKWFRRLLVGGLSLTIAAVASTQFFVRRSNPQFAFIAEQTLYKGQPFTGIIFDFYQDYSPLFLGFAWLGKRTLSERQWYPEGGLWYEDQYSQGVLHGEARMWYQDGKVKHLSTYVNGVRHGRSYGWHANGQIADLNLYDHGKEISHKAWISDGVPFYNYVYQDGEKVGIKGGAFCKLRKLPGS